MTSNRQEIGTAELMFVQPGPVIVLDTVLTVAGNDGFVMPATFVLANDVRLAGSATRSRALQRWAALGVVATAEVTSIDGSAYLSLAAGNRRLTFKLAGCVSRPRLVIEAA